MILLIFLLKIIMDRPGIGTAIFIRKDNSVLMSYRKDNGFLALPGGHLERFE